MQLTNASRLTSNKRLLMIAALLATSTAVEFDAEAEEGVRIRAGFERTQSPELLTANNYRILIDRVNLESDEVDIRPRHEGDLDRVLAHLDGPTIDVGPTNGLQPEMAELVLTNARFEGRVFDAAGNRLPAEGLGISGHVPLNVRLERTGDEANPVEIRFEVPTRFFDGIEWSA